MLELQYTTIVEGNAVRWGKMGNGPPLVAIHGTSFSSQVWRRIAPQLADRGTVYYFDLVGYGQSEMREGQDVSLGVQNKTLAALFLEWRVDAVALAPWGSAFVQHVRKHEGAFSGIPDYMHRALLRAYLQTAVFNPLSDQALEIYSAPWLGPTGQPAFYRQIAQMDQKFTDEVEGRYGRMECPVAVLWGQNDEWIPFDQGVALAAAISDADCIPVSDAGHLVQEDRPEAIVAAVLKVLD